MFHLLKIAICMFIFATSLANGAEEKYHWNFTDQDEIIKAGADGLKFVQVISVNDGYGGVNVDFITPNGEHFHVHFAANNSLRINVIRYRGGPNGKNIIKIKDAKKAAAKIRDLLGAVQYYPNHRRLLNNLRLAIDEALTEAHIPRTGSFWNQLQSSPVSSPAHSSSSSRSSLYISPGMHIDSETNTPPQSATASSASLADSDIRRSLFDDFQRSEDESSELGEHRETETETETETENENETETETENENETETEVEASEIQQTLLLTYVPEDIFPENPSLGISELPFFFLDDTTSSQPRRSAISQVIIRPTLAILLLLLSPVHIHAPHGK